MHRHPVTHVLVIDHRARPRLSLLADFFDRFPHMHVQSAEQVPSDLCPGQVVVTALDPIPPDAARVLEDHARAGGGWLHVVPPTAVDLPAALGVDLSASGTRCELRVLFARADHPLSARLPDAFYATSEHRPVALTSGDVETVLHADWRRQHTPVLVRRQLGDGHVACTTLADFAHPEWRQIVYRLVRQMSGVVPELDRLRIGVLGYAPSVGRLHGQGAVDTPGLDFVAACDINSDRLEQARLDFPSLRVLDRAADLAADTEVDLVIVATPPSTHAALAAEMLEAGKHVVCEKPLALTRGEAGTMAEASERNGLHLSCHQNRRFDPDYLVIRRILAEGTIGEPFYLESFVGGYAHPCGFWHSDAEVSGGTTYDWGAHYIDWVVSLLDGTIEEVIGTRHKRVWHDVTNADQERIQIRFEGGREADFVHSDIAAARKPKWYVLGTLGAIVGHWRDETEYEIDPLHYFRRHDIPATEMPPELTVHLGDGSGAATTLRPHLPDRPPFAFHRNLADHLLWGEPIAAPLEDSIRVTAVLEAASRSMRRGGRIEALHV